MQIILKIFNLENLLEIGNNFFKIGAITIQHGESEIFNSEAQNGKVFDFPTSFKNKCLTIVATDVGSGTRTVGLDAISKKQFKAFSREGTTVSGCRFHWLAVGF